MSLEGVRKYDGAIRTTAPQLSSKFEMYKGNRNMCTISRSSYDKTAELTVSSHSSLTCATPRAFDLLRVDICVGMQRDVEIIDLLLYS